MSSPISPAGPSRHSLGQSARRNTKRRAGSSTSTFIAGGQEAVSETETGRLLRQSLMSTHVSVPVVTDNVPRTKRAIAMILEYIRMLLRRQQQVKDRKYQALLHCLLRLESCEDDRVQKAVESAELQLMQDAGWMIEDQHQNGLEGLEIALSFKASSNDSVREECERLHDLCTSHLIRSA